MSQRGSIRFTILSVSLLTVTTVATSSREVLAINRLSNKASADFFFNLIRKGEAEWRANYLAAILDPVSVDATQFTMSFQYDSLKYSFRQSSSGPLGAFAVGGDAPPIHPGIVTMPVQELPSTGYNAGAPLPGSTLTYTDIGGVLTMTYELGSPITVSDPVNFFRLDFDILNSIEFSPSESSVTFNAVAPGADFTQTNFSCLTTDASNACGSEHPTTGVTINLVPTPEPSTFALCMLAAALATCFRCHRTLS
jgi:hypothetical protein